jgi:hypothetical protein
MQGDKSKSFLLIPNGKLSTGFTMRTSQSMHGLTDKSLLRLFADNRVIWICRKNVVPSFKSN